MKNQVQKRPTRGGLTPVRVDDLEYKTGLTVELVCKEIIIRPKSLNNLIGDNIETKYEKRIIDEDGQVVSIKKLSYVVKDTGDLCEYDVIEENNWTEDILNNKDNIIETDENGKVLSVTDKNAEIIEPNILKGENDLDSEIILTKGSEPLADWTAAIGDLITNAVVNQMLIRNGYDGL